MRTCSLHIPKRFIATFVQVNQLNSPERTAYPWRCRLVGSAGAGEPGAGTYPSSAILRSSGDGHAFRSWYSAQAAAAAAFLALIVHASMPSTSTHRSRTGGEEASTDSTGSVVGGVGGG